MMCNESDSFGVFFSLLNSTFFKVKSQTVDTQLNFKKKERINHKEDKVSAIQDELRVIYGPCQLQIKWKTHNNKKYTLKYSADFTIGT